LLSPEEDVLLPDFGIGLTDLAKGVSGMDRDVPRAKLRPNAVRDLVARYRPAILAFNGKGAASAVLGKGSLERVAPDQIQYSHSDHPVIPCL